MRILREYQNKIITDIKESWKSGYKSPCVVAPCGSGKSVLLAELARLTTHNKKKVMFIVHRKELCDQIRKTFIEQDVDMDYCNINMVQTLVRRLDTTDRPDLIMIDENHHCVSKSYKKIVDHYKDVYKVGVTATPIRLDGRGLIETNDKLIETVSCKWLLDNKYLSPARIYSAPLINLKNVKNSKGDYDTKECELLLDKSVIYGDVIKHYKEKADGRKTIIYCVSVKHSENTVIEFNNAGITACHIDGTTPKTQRDDIINKFRSGEIQVLSNCDIVSEGFDIPDCECVILLRPTQSLSLYIQQALRCMRYVDGKESVILDHVANTYKHGLPWQNREWTLEGKKRGKQKEKEKSDIWTCERCFNVWSKEEGRICPNCSLELPLSEREIQEQKNIELVEILESDFKKSHKSRREEYKRIQEARGYKKGWIWHQIQKDKEEHERKINKINNNKNIPYLPFGKAGEFSIVNGIPLNIINE